MPRPRFYNLPQERRHEIIVAAGRAFGRDGYEGASLNRILEEAGLSKGAAYYYFDGKDDLFATVVLAVWERFISALPFDPTALTVENFWESLTGLAVGFVDQAHDDAWTGAVIKAMWALPTDMRTTGPLAEAFNGIVRWYSAILHHGRSLGLIRSDLPEELLLAITWSIDSAADRWLAAHWDEFDEAELSRHAAAMFDVFRRVLVPAK